MPRQVPSAYCFLLPSALALSAIYLLDIYFLTYANSIESNLLQMILAKEKLTLFMKGQDVDLNEVYDRFNINYDLLSLLMVKEQDEKGVMHIQWGKQQIA